jgi:hypothetical protein
MSQLNRRLRRPVQLHRAAIKAQIPPRLSSSAHEALGPAESFDAAIMPDGKHDE